MKKFVPLIVFSLFCLTAAFAYTEVLEGDKVCYDKNSASYTPYNQGCFALVKKINAGTGNYSEFYDENGNLFYMSPSSYEFFAGDRFIGFNNDELKFYEIKGKSATLLSKEDVGKLFGDYEIILISNFDKDKKYRMKNSLFKSKKILLLNDTNRTFHKFFVYPESSRNSLAKDLKVGMIKSLITVYGKKNVRLKHFGGDEFEIVVK